MNRGEKLKQLRSVKGLTQAQVLKDLDKMNMHIDKNTLSNAENNENISNTTLEILANYYEVSFDYLKRDDIENTTNINIEINKILGLSDLSIDKLKMVYVKKDFPGIDCDLTKNWYEQYKELSKIKRKQDKKNLSEFNTNPINTWIENYKDFEGLFYALLQRYYFLLDLIKAVQYFSRITDIAEIIMKMEKTELTEFCSMLKKRAEIIAIEYDFENKQFFEELYELIDMLENKKDDLKHICSGIAISGDVLYSDMIRDIKLTKSDLIESISNSLPVKYSLIDLAYYDEDMPVEYKELMDKKVKNNECKRNRKK